MLVWWTLWQGPAMRDFPCGSALDVLAGDMGRETGLCASWRVMRYSGRPNLNKGVSNLNGGGSDRVLGRLDHCTSEPQRQTWGGHTKYSICVIPQW